MVMREKVLLLIGCSHRYRYRNRYRNRDRDRFRNRLLHTSKTDRDSGTDSDPEVVGFLPLFSEQRPRRE